LTGTAGVIAGLCLLSVPLRKLTSAPPAREVTATAPTVSAATIPTVLRIKLLAPARKLSVTTHDGTVLLELLDRAVGESEHDVAVRLTDDELDLTLAAEFEAESGETAVFLTVMPDGYEEKTAYATGGGVIEESLRFEWHHAHTH
jgi:hypothetical protein